MADGPESDEGSGDIEGHLDDVGPDHCRHSSFEGVEQGQAADDGNGEYVSGADGERDDDGDGEDADPFGGGAGEQEEAGGELVQRVPEASVVTEAAIDELVGGQHLAAKVARQKEQRDDNAPEHIAEYDLKEAEIAGKGDTRDGDDGQGAGFG